MSRPVRGRSKAVAVGQHVFLRPPTMRDAAEWCATFSQHPRHFSRWGHPPYTPEHYRRMLRGPSDEVKQRFLICRCTDGALVGSIALGQIVRGLYENAYTGYYLARQHTGQGYMTEALSLALRYAFRVLKLHRVEANIQPENAPSIAVVRRCGFRREGFSPRMLKIGGRWRDHERWAITIEDWRAWTKRRQHPRPTRRK